MKVEQLFVYPIKSLRGSSIPRAEILSTGFRYDRTFMLLKITEDGHKNMQVSKFPEMCLFTTEIVLPDLTSSEKSRGHIVVSFMDANNPSAPKRRLHVPLEPDTDGLNTVTVDMYGSTTEAHCLGPDFDDWFSSCFGYPVILTYIGNNRRPVLGNLPSARSSRSSFSDLKDLSTASSPSSLLHQVALFWQWLWALILSLFPSKTPKAAVITFADCAPLLTVTTASLADVATRIPEATLPLDVTKFRPNILVNGSSTAWAEDFWSFISFQNPSLASSQKVRVELTANCARCVSLNVDFETGKFVDEKSAVLKKLMKDRRVDRGVKWSPIFGRYGFPTNGGVISVGDEVQVEGKNDIHSKFEWPGLAE